MEVGSSSVPLCCCKFRKKYCHISAVFTNKQCPNNSLNLAQTLCGAPLSHLCILLSNLSSILWVHPGTFGTWQVCNLINQC